MPRPRVYKTQAIVLRQRKLGEADKIVTLYSSHGGKIDAVAKGIRRTKSRMAGHLEPLTLGSYLLAEGRDLDILTQAETIDAFPRLRADLDRNYIGGIERGERNPSLVNICRIAGARAVEVTELLEGVLAIAPDA